MMTKVGGLTPGCSILQAKDSEACVATNVIILDRKDLLSLMLCSVWESCSHACMWMGRKVPDQSHATKYVLLLMGISRFF